MILLRHKNKYLMILFILLLITGCKKEKEGKLEISKKDMAPKSLQDLNKGIMDILGSVSELEKIDLGIDIVSEQEEIESGESDTNNEEGSEGDKGQNSQDSEGEDEKDSKSDSQNQNSQDEEATKEEKLKQSWDQADKKMKEVHSFWISYEAEGMKKGATSDKGSEFETALNKMTKAIANRRILDSFDYGSQSLQGLKSYYDLYGDEIGGDIAQLEYLVYQYYIRARAGDKESASRIVANENEAVNRIRLKLKDDKKKEDDLDRIALAIKNLPRSLKEDSKQLFIIKRDTLIEDLKALGQ